MTNCDQIMYIPVRGCPGDKGETGDMGGQGPPGRDAPPGVNGIDGVDGVAGVNGVGGPDGYQGSVGPSNGGNYIPHGGMILSVNNPAGPDIFITSPRAAIVPPAVETAFPFTTAIGNHLGLPAGTLYTVEEDVDYTSGIVGKGELTFFDGAYILTFTLQYEYVPDDLENEIIINTFMLRDGDSSRYGEVKSTLSGTGRVAMVSSTSIVTDALIGHVFTPYCEFVSATYPNGDPSSTDDIKIKQVSLTIMAVNIDFGGP